MIADGALVLYVCWYNGSQSDDDDKLDRQSTSVNPLFGLVEGFISAMTTLPSDVDRNNSGRHDGAYCRGNTAMHWNDKCFDRANIPVGRGVMIA